MTWNDWAYLHYVSGIVLTGLVVLHLWMNRTWIQKILVQKKGVYLILLLVLALFLIAGPLLLPAID